MNHCRNALTCPLSFPLQGGNSSRIQGRDAVIGLACARSTRAFPGRALREQRDRSSHLFPSTYPSQRIWKFPRGWRGWPQLRAWNEHRFIVRVLRAKRPAPPSPTRTLFSALPDTPPQSSPNPSETDPYPSTPLSSGPRIGRCPEKSHRPGSACRCALRIPV
jgi:hypothetical protein